MASSSPTGGAPSSDPESREHRRAKKVTCSFCNCELDTEGEIIAMGKKAKEFRAMGENDETRIARITALEAEITSLKAKLAESVPATAPPATAPTGRKSVLDTLVPLRR